MRKNPHLIDMTKQNYPEGTRVELIEMKDKQAPPAGTLGTVQHVDDYGTVFVKWDNGTTIGAVLGVDMIRKPVLHEYDVSCKIEGRFHVTVKAKSLKEAAEKASNAYYDADFGDLEESDMELVHIINEKGEYNYPPFNSDIKT